MNREQKTIEEELSDIQEAPFKFGCMGINCLGWLTILTILLVIYLLRGKIF